MKTRLDVLMVERGLAESREKAKAIIMSGNVFVDGQREDKAGASFPEKAVIEVKGSPLKYVSRAPSENLSKEDFIMSRIGRLPVAIPEGVTVTVEEGNKVTVKGPKGTLERVLPAEMTIKVEDGHVVVTRPNDLKKMKSLHGLTRTLISNMVTGVHTGYEKVLEVNGVGYRCSKSGNKLTLNLGYSHPVEMTDPEGLEAVVDGNKITVKGIDKEKVGQYAAEIRDKRRPEPYKGKGIKYETEVIRRKVGKTGKK